MGRRSLQGGRGKGMSPDGCLVFAAVRNVNTYASPSHYDIRHAIFLFSRYDQNNGQVL